MIPTIIAHQQSRIIYSISRLWGIIWQFTQIGLIMVFLIFFFFLLWPNSGETCLWDQFGCLLSLCNQPQWPPKAAASKSQPDACRRCSATEFISVLCASLLSYPLSVCNNKPFAHKVKKTLTECIISAHQAKLFKHLQWEQFA